MASSIIHQRSTEQVNYHPVVPPVKEAESTKLIEIFRERQPKTKKSTLFIRSLSRKDSPEDSKVKKTFNSVFAEPTGTAIRRVKLKEEIDNVLFYGQSPGRQLVVLRGPAGSGKSYFAEAYLSTLSRKEIHRLWISWQNFFYDYRKIGEELANCKPTDSPDQVRKKVKFWLEKNEDYLLVIQGVDKLEELLPFLPKKGGRFLITTEDESWPGSIPFPRLCDEEAEELLIEWMGDEKQKELSPKKIDEESEYTVENWLTIGALALEQTHSALLPSHPKIQEFIQRLKNHPLSLLLAGSLIQDSGLSLDDYLSQLKDINNPLKDCCEISLNHLRQKSSVGVIRLLAACYLNPCLIPSSFFDNEKDHLIKLGLIFRSGEFLRMKSSLQKLLPDLATSEERQGAIDALLKFFLKEWLFQIKDRSTWPKAALLAPGLSSICKFLNYDVEISDRFQPLVMSLAEYYEKVENDFQRAIFYYQMVLETPNDDFLSQRLALGRTLIAEGLVEDAEAELLKCLNLLEDEETEIKAFVQEELARCYQMLGRLDDGIQRLDLAFKIWKEKDDVSGMARTLTYIGDFSQAKGKGDLAFDFFERALDSLPSKAKERYDIQQRMGFILQQKEDFFQAISYLTGALQKYRSNDSIDFNDCRGFVDLGFAYEQWSQIDVALASYKTALQIMDSSEDSPQEVTVFYRIARIFLRQGRYFEAIEYFQEYIERAKAQSVEGENWIGLAHREMFIAYYELGEFNLALGELVEFFKWVEPGRISSRQFNLTLEFLNQDFWYQSSSYLYLKGYCLLCEGKAKESLQVFSDALNQIASRDIKAMILKSYGLAFLTLGEVTEAQIFLKNAYEEILPISQKEPILLAKILIDLGTIHRRQNEQVNAIKKLKEALSLLEDLGVGDPLLTASALYEMGVVIGGEGSKIYLVNAFKIQNRTLDKTDLSLIQTKMALEKLDLSNPARRLSVATLDEL